MNQSITPTDAREASFLFPTGKEAIFHIPSNSFRFRQPPVPVHSFSLARARILRASETLVEVLDLSAEMGLPYPATTPNLLARYIRIGSDDAITITVNAASEIYYVLEGVGVSVAGDARFEWKAGDVFIFPGGAETLHKADLNGALLFQVTEEPLLSFSGFKPLPRDEAVVKPAYFPREMTEKYLQLAYDRPADGDETSKTVIFVTEATREKRTTTPWITTNYNTLDAGGDQRPHRHNSAAITLTIESEGIHSMIEGQKVDWECFGALVTPPQALHSHHNRGNRRMTSFVMQDSGFYYHARAVGFSFDD